jgi:hypothetical protein
VSKAQLKNYLETFITTYRNYIKNEYPAYFNQFPFYGPLKAVGVITHNKVYIIFTKDGKPKRTTIEIFDENDIPDLMRVKDAIEPKWDDIFALLNIETYIFDLLPWDQWVVNRMNGNAQNLTEEYASRVALASVRFHYGSVEKGTEPIQVFKGEAKPTAIVPKYDFVYNTMDERLLRSKVDEIFNNAEEGEEVLITGWIGSFAIPLVNALDKKNVKFRIITHRPTPPERGKSPSDEYEVFKILTGKYCENVRILTNLHARLLISPKQALVSTADLTKDSHEGKYEAGISTTDGLTILQLKKFFEKMWEQAEPLKT